MAYTFPIEKYLSTIGLPNESNLSPTKSLLDRIIEHHTMHFPFQNFQLFHSVETRNKIDLSAEGLVKNFLIHKQGGMCYQQSEFLFHVLSSLGYNVRRLPVFVTMYGPYRPGLTSYHNLLMANLDGQNYLLDVGFGYNSLRLPLPITLDGPTEVAFNDHERYQWVHHGDHYELNSWIVDRWRPFYCINTPFTPLDAEGTLRNLLHLCSTSEVVEIRDKVMRLGLLTRDGRIAYHCEPFGDKFIAYRMIIKNGDVCKHHFPDMASFAQDIEQTMGLTIPPTMPGYTKSST